MCLVKQQIKVNTSMSAYQGKVIHRTSVPIVMGHGVQTRPTALIPRQKARHICDLSDTFECRESDFINPTSSTPQIGFGPPKTVHTSFTRPSSKSNLPAYERTIPFFAPILLTPKVSDRKLNKKVRIKTEPLEENQQFTTPSKILKTNTGSIEESIQECLVLENSHLKAENEMLKEELQFLRDKFRKVLGKKFRPGCQELL